MTTDPQDSFSVVQPPDNGLRPIRPVSPLLFARFKCTLSRNEQADSQLFEVFVMFDVLCLTNHSKSWVVTTMVARWKRFA